VLHAQASCLGIPLITRPATWSEYESVFIKALRELKQEGVEAGIFGDIDLEDHRLWEKRVCRSSGIEAYLPLWKSSRNQLLGDFLSLGFKAMIIATHDQKMGNTYLGKILDAELAEEFARIGIDPSGEGGEYHTVVFDGPIFRQPMELKKGESVLRSGLWYLDVQPVEPATGA
jgi:diphthine-ammonia ligase